MSLAALRKERDTATLAHLWGLARTTTAAPGKRCASCARPTAQVSLELPDGPLVLDVCKMCQMVWFDRDELERIPKQPQRAVEPQKELPPEAKVAYAQAMVSMMQEQLREENQREQAMRTASRILGVLDLLD